MKIVLAQINPIIGALAYNKKKILNAIEEAKAKNADLVVFPELAITGYPPEDLLLYPSFVDQAYNTLLSLQEATKGIVAIVGGIRKNPDLKEKPLFNTAAIFSDGALLGFQDKTLLPDYDVFYERRYFEPAQMSQIFTLCGKKVAVTICEDIWQHAGLAKYSSYFKDPVLELKKKGPELLVNLSASPFYLGRKKDRHHVVTSAAKTLKCDLVFCNQVGGNDGLIFDGSSLAVDKEGSIIAEAPSFKEAHFVVEKTKAEPSNPVSDLFQALVLGVRDYFGKQGFKKGCFGLSGGIDSAVLAVIAREALGADNLLALMLPSRFTSKESLQEASKLAKNLGIVLKELSIEAPFETIRSTLAFKGFDTTEENLQARIRGIILMAYSNKEGYILLNGANKSEVAVGYTTLYGDMCGGLSVLSDVTKDYVYKLACYINRDQEIIPSHIITREPSAELNENQEDSDSLPPYPVLDAIIKGYIEEHQSPEEISQENNIALPLVKTMIQKIHKSEYKRKQSPPGIRVTKRAFSVGRRFPIVHHWDN